MHHKSFLFCGLKINEKQKAFVEHYIETFNAQEACHELAYKPKVLCLKALS